MIHSLAGGSIKDLRVADFAKVEYLEDELAGSVGWYITEIFGLKAGDEVLVPYNNRRVRAKVVRIDKHVSEQSSPISMSRAKNIIKKFNTK
jgi:hypothetical protein